VESKRAPRFFCALAISEWSVKSELTSKKTVAGLCEARMWGSKSPPTETQPSIQHLTNHQGFSHNQPCNLHVRLPAEPRQLFGDATGKVVSNVLMLFGKYIPRVGLDLEVFNINVVLLNRIQERQNF